MASREENLPTIGVPVTVLKRFENGGNIRRYIPVEWGVKVGDTIRWQLPLKHCGGVMKVVARRGKVCTFKMVNIERWGDQTED